MSGKEGMLDDLLRDLRQLLDLRELEPDAARKDWALAAPMIDRLYGCANGALEDATRGSTHERQVEVADLVAMAAAVVFAAIGTGGAQELLGRAARLAVAGPQRDGLEAAVRDPRAFNLLARAGWLDRHDDGRGATLLRKEVVSSTREAALRAAARAGLNDAADDGPAVRKPPSLARLNGCGVALYGHRDERGDGSYVATWCVSFLFVPLLPLRAYRVLARRNRVFFVSREPLSWLARMAGVASVLATAALIAGISLAVYVRTDGYRLAQRMAAARQAEARGDADDAMRRYDELLHEFKTKVDGAKLAPAAEGVVRLVLATATEPFTPAQVEQAVRVVHRFEQLPAIARRGPATALLVGALLRWVDQIGQATPAHVEAGLRLLALLPAVTPDANADEGRRAPLQRALAASVVADEPLHALQIYATMDGDTEGLAAADRLVTGIESSASLLREAQDDMRVWISSAGRQTNLSAHATLVSQALDQAIAEDRSNPRLELIEQGDEARLRAQLASVPADQEVAVALADTLRAAGNADGARVVLEALGPPGLLIGEARLLLCALYADAGELERADALLTRYLALRLPPFQDAQQRYAAGERALRERLDDDADHGRLPAELIKRLDGASEQNRSGIYQAWLAVQLEQDHKLSQLRARFVRYASVIRASLAAAGVKLQRASHAGGDERQRLLGEAERTLLAVQQVAEGDPSYHLALGEIYYRLDRVDEGEAELQRVLAAGRAYDAMDVAEVYRELGMRGRARAVLQHLYETSTDTNVREETAGSMARVVGNENEAELWLGRAGTRPDAQRQLAGLAGRRLRREGKLADADAKFAWVATEWEREAAHDDSAANNAGLAYQQRYLCTGDMVQLVKAVQLLDQAHRLDPHSAIVSENLAGMVLAAARIRVLARWIDVSTLRLDGRDAATLLNALMDGPLREDVAAALRKERGLARAVQLLQEVEALAPLNSDSYLMELNIHARLDDDGALAKLLARVERVTFETTDEDAGAQTAAEPAGQDTVDPAVAAATRLVADAERGGKQPTIAAALLLRSNAVYASASTSASLVREALGDLRKADALWPSSGARAGVAWMLLSLALAEAKETSPPLAHSWDADFDFYSIDTFLERLMQADDAETMIAAVRAQPELGEAMKLLRSEMRGRPDLADWALARLAGDDEYRRFAAGAFDRESYGLALRIRAKLYPDSEEAADRLERFNARGK